MPFYNSASCAIALDVAPKWLDNLLSHHVISGVQQARQGVPRRLSSEAIEVIAVARTLTDSLGIPMGVALDTSHKLCNADDTVIALTTAISLSLDLNRLRIDLAHRLERAMEETPQPRRGRPPGRNGINSNK